MNLSLQDKPRSNQMADSWFPTAVISHFYSAVYLGNGNSPWAKMIRWQREHPGIFCRTYRKRNTIERCFSAIKDRFNFRVRSVTLEMQKRELAIIVHLP